MEGQIVGSRIESVVSKERVEARSDDVGGGGRGGWLKVGVDIDVIRVVEEAGEGRVGMPKVGGSRQVGHSLTRGSTHACNRHLLDARVISYDLRTPCAFPLLFQSISVFVVCD